MGFMVPSLDILLIQLKRNVEKMETCHFPQLPQRSWVSRGLRREGEDDIIFVLMFKILKSFS